MPAFLRKSVKEIDLIDERFLKWLRNVSKEHRRVEKKLTEEGVHDLRVAIRRTRTMAKTFLEIKPDPAFEKIGRETKKLFRALGELRDAQVMSALAEKFSPSAAAKKKVLKTIWKLEKRGRKKSEKRVRGFNRGCWKKIEKKLASGQLLSHFVTCAFRPMALRLLGEALKAHKKAEKSGGDAAYHAARICFKKFRYFVENFVSDLDHSCGPDLEKIQDLLGNNHDLANLEQIALAKEKKGGVKKAWKKTIGRQKRACLDGYRDLFRKRDLWTAWKEKLEAET